MLLRLIREPSTEGCTLGSLYVDQVWECWMLEDVIREMPGVPVASWKVQGRTAIPEGRYQIDLTLSQRFGRVLPLLVGVPGFDGVRIHPGNVPEDTEGCLLPGSQRYPSRITGSRVAFDRLFARLEAATDERWIVIENPTMSNITKGLPGDGS